MQIDHADGFEDDIAIDLQAAGTDPVEGFPDSVVIAVVGIVIEIDDVDEWEATLTNAMSGRSSYHGLMQSSRIKWTCFWFLVIATGFSGSLWAAGESRVLVYTRNHVTDGKGYVHDNIATSVEAIRKIGSEHRFTVDATDDPSVFTDANLRKYRTIIFSNSNNEAFENDAQRQAFQHFIHHGGGFVGIHSASGSERNWPYFWSVLGGSFAAHPHYQRFDVQVVNRSLPGMKDVPATFSWNDECYFIGHLNPDIRPVLTTRKSALTGTDAMHLDLAAFAENLPLAWFHRFDHGREFYLALGHAQEDYSNPLFLKILTAGILWANH